MSALDDYQKLGFGDQVSFRVVEDQDEPRSLIISDAGNLNVPYIGLVPVHSMTCKQLAKEIKSLLEKNYYYQATVIIAVELLNKKRVLGKVYVVGQIRSPGAQEIPDDEPYTVSKAILKAGGFSDFADKKKVRLVRNINTAGQDKKTFIINLVDI